MSLLNEAHITIFKEYVQTQLAPICEADPNVLSDYIIALLRHDMEGEYLKQYCKEQLEDFLRDDTNDFVDKIFDSIATQSFLPKPESPKPIAQSPPKIKSTKHPEQNGSPGTQFMPPSKLHHPSQVTNKPLSSFQPQPSSEASYPPSVYESDLPLQQPPPQTYQPTTHSSYTPSVQNLRTAAPPPPVPQHRRLHEHNFQQQHTNIVSTNNAVPPTHFAQNFAPSPQPRAQPHIRVTRRGFCHEFFEKGTCSRGEPCPYEHVAPQQLQPQPQPQPQTNNGYAHPPSNFETRDFLSHPPSHTLPPTTTHFHHNSPSYMTSQPQTSPIPPSQPPITAYHTRHSGPLHAPINSQVSQAPPLSAQLESRIRPHVGGVHSHQHRDSPNSIVARLGHRDTSVQKSQLRGTFHPKSVPNSAIVVEGIPFENCRAEPIQSFFSKFGHVEHVQLAVSEQRAVVYYKTIEEAKLAHSSPEPIFGNRFIKVYFFHPDRHHMDATPSTVYPPTKATSLPNTYGAEKPTSNPHSTNFSPYYPQHPAQQLKVQPLSQPSAAPTPRKTVDQDTQKLAEALKKEQLDRELDMISQQIQLAAKTAPATSSYTPPTSTSSTSNFLQAPYVGYSFAFTDMMYEPPMPEVYLPPASSSLVNWDHVKSRYCLDLRPSIVTVTYPDPEQKDALLEQFHNFGEINTVTDVSTDPTLLQLQLHYKTRAQAEKAFQFGPTLPGFTSTIQVAWKN
ncbi:RNA-binding protein 26 [Coelomomyces lativittatus]|nr:RNA-binding protein 26 [Coelomomyces lativittatus]KAJ1515380.1 RNA-binding protein 26 [Coelomomyces lativittatus]KAJ1518618.1 RNA-binding protein 26 [Coelomomyces lativittatus]